MHTNKHNSYQAPAIESIDIATERGFAQSYGDVGFGDVDMAGADPGNPYDFGNF